MVKLLRFSALGLLFVSVTTLAENKPLEIDQLLIQWTQMEQQRSHIESQWRQRKDILTQQLVLLADEEKVLNDSLSENSDQRDDVEQQRFELLQQQTNMEQTQHELSKRLAVVVEQVLGFRHRLPPPLKDQWDQELDALTMEDIDSSEKLELLLQALSQLEDFENRIALHQSVMTVADGVERKVQQFYLGLSQGWYVDAKGEYAGYGRSSAQGWQWLVHTQVEGLEPQVLKKVVTMLTQQQHAEFVSLPIDFNRLSALAVSKVNND
ncbi:MAG: DUF3450 family protein, partial [Spongiibacteraceae bacterium]|nr:DUF3450 family protein [Spongiibacteraceae bacterium]